MTFIESRVDFVIIQCGNKYKSLSFQVRFIGTTGTLGKFVWCQLNKFLCISFDLYNS